MKLDVLALTEEALGYTNLWYESALENAIPFVLPNGVTIRIITAPHFLGTKMEAFRGRGKTDFFASHDLEDFIAIIEGRPTILPELRKANLGRSTTVIFLGPPRISLKNRVSWMPFQGLLLDDDRVPLILERLKRDIVLGRVTLDVSINQNELHTVLRPELNRSTELQVHGHQSKSPLAFP